MTFEELDQRYPNGFDDAEITSIAISYRTRTAAIELNLRGQQPESSASQIYRPGLLTIQGFYYFSIEPPDIDHLHQTARPLIQVDGLSEDPREFPLFERVKPNLPAGAFSCRLFVHDWNSFIHIAARDAQFSWT